MEFKLAPIEVPADDPFRYDALERKASVETLSNLVNALQGPFVLAIDSPWGTGKTTFIRIWKAFLESQNFVCLYYSAWETDFSTDPLLAFLGELEHLEKSIKTKNKNFATYFDKTKKIATILAKRALPVAGKIATAGLFDLDAFTEKALSELVSGSITDAVDAYSAEKDLIKRFHESLSKSIATLQMEGKKNQLIVFVDEVDRCRPTFAIELLERIKHLFNVENVIFILALDKGQLAVSLKAVYGEGLNTEEYLRRFLDLEYSLPKVNTEAFTRNLFSRFGFEDFFAERTHSELRYDKQNLEEVFNTLADLFRLNLRAREQCFTQVRVAMMTTPPTKFFYPLLLTTLVILKVVAPEIYKRYALEGGPASDVVQHLSSLNGGPELLNERYGIVIEAYLIASKAWRHDTTPDLEHYKKILENPSENEPKKERANQLLDIIKDMRIRDAYPSLEYVVNKIELAAQFKT
jgi:hypothetical protein